MLSKFDDYPIHQTPDPLNVPASSDRDVYERYWFNGYSLDGDVFIAVGTALYPHLGLQDCGISILIDGEQHAFHASARATPEPSDLTIGPYELSVVEPMLSTRITLDDNETGYACDLLFEGRSGNVEEPRHVFPGRLRAAMDTTRFTQLGRWSGWIRIGDRTIEFDPETMLATKDRSWGIRPLAGGDRRAAPPAPGKGGGIFFLWAPLHFGDLGVHYQLFEDPEGRTMYNVGAFVPIYPTAAEVPGVEDAAARHMRNLEHDVTFAADSRMIESATLAFSAIDDGTRYEIECEKLMTFRMKGIGYSHPEWGHGMWKGELAMSAEKWSMADVDDTAFENQHVQHLIRVRMGDRTGIGALEQHIVGPYAPYGFAGAIAR